jgi:hypothetical protein
VITSNSITELGKLSKFDTAQRILDIAYTKFKEKATV